jgi:plasmid stability protein
MNGKPYHPNLDESVKQQLRIIAFRNDRSMEAEARDMIVTSVSAR